MSLRELRMRSLAEKIDEADALQEKAEKKDEKKKKVVKKSSRKN